MATAHQRRGPATLDDLAREPGKAEWVAGRIVRLIPTGFRPGQVAANIYDELKRYSRRTRRGAAVTENMGYVVPELPSGRRSFSPDASYFVGPWPANDMRFLEGPPRFAVEVRSEHDVGPAALATMAAKRADYFAAGTLVVWDVDPVAEVVASYKPDRPDDPALFGRGEVADAEPAVPGWRVDVDAIFDLMTPEELAGQA